ncbi:sensor histidine kinase [Micromonospora sp. DT47]|uniref:sensor histidine kinase n=1 Tax=Micromonospora sp. DT47 TaxID=3393431 RepID=UPI003CF25213
MNKSTLLALASGGLGVVNLGAVLGLGQYDVLVSSDLWVPLTASAMGWLVVRHAPGNAVGWLLLGMAISSALFGASAILVMEDVQIPGQMIGRWLSAWVFLPSYYFAFTLIPLLFPDGRLPGRGWRPVLWAATTLVALESLLLAFGSRESIEPTVANPFVIESVAGLLAVVEPVIWLTMPALVLLGLGSLTHRLFQANGAARAQVLCMLVGAGLGVALWLLTGSGLLIAVLLPTAIAVAVLRYRLYDLERVLAHTLTYSFLAVVAGLVYLAVAVTVGRLLGADLRGQVLGTVVAVLAVHPLRDRFMRWARRAVYGAQHDQLATLAAAAEQIGEAGSPADALPRLAGLLQETFWAEHVAVVARVSSTDRVAATAPRGARTDEAHVTRTVLHQGAPVGSVEIWRDWPLTGAESRLLDRLTRQVGPALHTVALTERLTGALADARDQAEQLRASRQRITQAHDAARRAIERNLHDGAQQGLLALNVGLVRLQPLVDPGARQRITELQALAQRTLVDLRTIASGAYPPALRELGIGAALRDSVAGLDTPVTVSDWMATRPPSGVETAVYFACLEAVTNAVKHARASCVEVDLRTVDGGCAFVVTDDGAGFDPSAVVDGSGLAGMADRLGACGGSLSVTSSPGQGTIVTGCAPMTRRETATLPEPDGAPALPR